MTPRESVLTFDLATLSGWAAWRPSGEITYGRIRIPPPSVGLGKRLCVFEGTVGRLLAEYEPKYLAYESAFVKPTDYKHAASETQIARLLFSLAAVTELAAYKAGVLVVRHVDARDVRKHFLGRANMTRAAAKAGAMTRCKQLGWNPADDNEADALAVLDYARACWRLHDGQKESAPLFAGG